MDGLIFLILETLVIVIVSTVLHEIMHGVVALWQGDHTARLSGRLSLNPLKHIDPWMSVALPLILAVLGGPIFGGAKPVPINPRNLKHGEWSMALVAIAGPLTNLVLAFVAYCAWCATGWSVLAHATMVNLGFATFNILPVPPLDESRVLYALAPNFVRDVMDKIERYGTTFVFVLVVVCGGLLSNYMYLVENAILGLFEKIVGF